MKFSQILALFAVLAVSVSACNDKIKHSKVQHQEANNNGAEISNNGDNVIGANNLLKGGVDLLSSDKKTVVVNQSQDQ